MYYKLYGLDTTCLRYFNVYGLRQDPSSPYSGVISIFTDKLSQNQTPTIFGNGEQTRDFVYVTDVVEANMAAVTRPVAGYVFNIATGKKITLNNLLQTLYDIYGQPFKADYEETRLGDIKDSYATIDKAKSILSWQPTVELEQGLRVLCNL